MQEFGEYRGYKIVESDWTTTVKVGFDREEVRPVYVIPGLKERPSHPFLTSVAEAREYIDLELDAREEAREAGTVRFTAVIRARGNSLNINIPASAVRGLGLEPGDEVEVAVRRP